MLVISYTIALQYASFKFSTYSTMELGMYVLDQEGNSRSLQGAFEQPEVTTIPNAICANWSYNQLFQGKDKQKKSKWLSKIVDCTPVGCGCIGQYIPSYKIENVRLFQFKLRQDYNS